MSHLVTNGTHLYYRPVIVGGSGGISHTENHLVSTPIRKQITILPSARKYYAIAGSYINGEPAGGFVVTPGGSGTISDYVAASAEAGRQMRASAVARFPSSDQIWRDVDANHEAAQRLFAFYDGGHNTSYRGSNASQTYLPSAYMQIPATYFEIPAAYSDWSIESISLTGTYNGTIIKYNKATSGDYPATGYEPWYNATEGAALPTSLLPNNSDWRNSTWPHQIGLYQDLSTADWQNLANIFANVARDSGGNAEVVSLPSGVAYEQGQQIAATSLWHVIGSELLGDGLIPTLASPSTQSVQLGSGMISKFSEVHSGKRGGWLICLPNIDASAGGFPSYTAPDPSGQLPQNIIYYWLTCSYYFTGITVNLVLDPS